MNNRHLGSTLVVLFFVLLALGSTESEEGQSTESAPAEKKWFQGGTLHNKSALEWQTASKEDKLATCADYVSTMWQNGNLKPSIANKIKTPDDLHLYAWGLVKFLDNAFKLDPDPVQNRKQYANQTVSGTAAIGMAMMEWTQ